MSRIAPEPDFETDNGFLHAVLGLLSIAVQIQSMAEDIREIPSVDIPQREDTQLYALLGVFKLAQHVRGIATSWAAEEKIAIPAVAAPSDGEAIREILR